LPIVSQSDNYEELHFIQGGAPHFCASCSSLAWHLFYCSVDWA